MTGSILPRHFGTGTLEQITEMANARTNYCFTYNNYTPAGVDNLKQWMEDNCKYGCFQEEVAPTTGTQHLQGYMNLHKKARMTTLQKRFGPMGIPLTLINANGTPEQNRTYCSKPGGNNFWETGNLNIVGQGKRSDLSIVSEKVLGKRSIAEVAGEHPETFIKYHRGIKELYFMLDEPANERELEVVLFFGDPNTGKSYKARMYAKLYGKYYTLGQPNNGALWWDGYKGEDSILIDEFKGWIIPTHLNSILDIYKLPLNTKGGTTYARYTHVFITSNYPPEEWYSDKVVWNRQSLLRRITSIYEYRGTDYLNVTVTKLK